MAWGPMARGAMVEDIGVDAFFNTPFLVNCTIKGIDPGTSGAHADAYQVATSNTDLPDNRIIYNFKATDLHVQGIFMTFEDHPNGTGTNCAFVNVMVEMREPSIGNPGHDFTPLILGGNAWDHLLLWHCSFPLGITGAGADFTNTSFIGNVFWQYFDVRPTSSGSNLSYAVYENPGNNDFLYNHFMNVYGETEPCTPTSADIAQDKSCPSYFARIVDSHQTGSVTTGGDVLDMANPASDGFGSPLADSILINRIPFPTVPADLYGNPRAGSPDVGAIERISAQDPAYMAPPADFKTAQ